MPVSRARIEVVLEKISQGLLADARAAAGNAVLSRTEGKGLNGLLKDAEGEARLKQGRNAKVTPKELSDEAMLRVGANIAQINQATGAGKATLSQEEIRRLQGVDGETAARAAKAYELITGKRITLDGTIPQSPPSALPDRARVALMDDLVNHYGLARAARVDISQVAEQAGAFQFHVKSNVFTGTLHAREVDGRFFFASKPFDAATIRLVSEKAGPWFDDNFKADMEGYGASAQEIAEARARFVPYRIMLAGESDPWSYTASYPLVVVIDNQTGSDHGVYAGVNPGTGEVEIYAFN